MNKFTKLLLVFILTVLVIAGLSKFDYRFENNVQDIFVRTFAKESQSSNIKLIIIDDKSTESMKFPWARDVYTDIFNFIKDNAKLIVFDAVVESKDEYRPESDKIFFNEIKKFDNLVVGYMFSYKPKYTPAQRDKLFEQKSGIEIKDNRTITSPDYVSFSNLPDEYLSNIKNLGYINISTDADGFLRTTIPVKKYQNKLYPSLALKAFSLASGINRFIVTDKFLCSDDGCKSFKMPVTSYRHGYVSTFGLVNWYKITNGDANTHFSHKAYSAIDVYNSYKQLLKNEVPLISPEEFKDSYVFVASCANNQLIKDKKNTPMSIMQAGVDYQATVFENMLTGKFMSEMPHWENLLIIFFMMFCSLILIRKTSIKTSVTGTFLVLLLYYIFAVIMITNKIQILLLTPLIMILFVFCIGYSYNFFVEDKHKRQLQKLMGQYLSKDLMRKIIKDMENIGVGGKRADVSIMFIDIRGFTSITEKLPPESIIEILNDYIAAVEPIVRKYNGMVNKFIGDAIMAIFGEPVTDKNHAKNAVLCGVEVLKVIKNLQEKATLQGKIKIEVGIGICTGEVFAGNIGTTERMEYTVIGDAVNTASRIEACNKIYRTKLLISEETYARVRGIVEVIEIKDVELYGKSKKVTIYEVLRKI